MANYYSSSHDLQQVSLGVPVQAVIKIKPVSGYFREDIRIHGDRIGIIDVNNRIREEYECQDIFDPSVPLHRIFEEAFPPYLRAAVEGVNVAMLAFGTTGSGKTFAVEGEGSTQGLIGHFAHSLFQMLEDKKFRLNAGRAPTMSSQGYTYSVKMRYVEIVDEEINDLLVHASSTAQGGLNIIYDEWEGPSISNTTWMPCSSAGHLLDMFSMAKRARTDAATEFGPLSDRATSLTTIELLQVASNVTQNDSSVLASRVYFIDLPGAEKLQEDAESLRIKEGNTLNKTILSLANLLNNLSQNQVDYVNYDEGMLTSLLKDILGGNCLTTALFTLQNGDPVGTSLVLNYMRLFKNIFNFPVVNDNRMLGLLRKFRVEISQLLNQLAMSSPEGIDGFNNKISQLEKEVIQGNLDKLRFHDEKQGVGERFNELKEQYNRLVQEKADLQGDLIKSEEERLMVSKALIELQIENAQLQEKASDKFYDVNNQLLNAENDILSANMKEEKAMAAVHEVQEKLKATIDEKRELEIEFVALKTNYMNLSNDLADEKLKTENLGIEVINLVNANKVLTGDADHLTKTKGDLSEDQAKLVLRVDTLSKAKRELEEALLSAKSEVEMLKTELLKKELTNQQAQGDFDNKKLDIERQFLDKSKNRENDIRTTMKETDMEMMKLKEHLELGNADNVALQRQLKVAQRKIAELEDHLNEYIKHDQEMTEEAHKLQMTVEEMRGNFRGKLIKAMNDGIKGDDPNLRNAREELIRSYNEREIDLTEKLNKEYARNAHQLKVIRGLRAYARSLKNLSEDWAPIGHPLPEILTMPPPILLEDEDQTILQKAQSDELERLRVKNRHLESEVKNLQSQLLSNTEQYAQIIHSQRNPNIQKRLMDELEHLKNAPVSTSRPGTGNYDADVLRKERNALREENKRLQHQLKDNMTGGPGAGSGGGTGAEGAMQQEIDRLNKKLRDLQSGMEGVDGSGNVRMMKQKIVYLENMMRNLEKERSELSVRATMAEEQLKNLHEQMNSSVQNYQRKISELKKIVQDLKGGRPMGDGNSGFGDSRFR